MVTATARQGAADLALLRALFARQEGAWARFVAQCQSEIYGACRLAFPDLELKDAFRDVLERLRDNEFALLHRFDGRAPLSVYLRLVLRDLLSQRVARLITEESGRGWRAFEHFFKRDIDRWIAQTFPDAKATGRDEDIYHEIVSALIENGYRRIRAYDGTGSFGGFVLRVVRNLCIDIQRRDMPRRRLPAAIQRLPATEQEVFRQLYWEQRPPEQLAEALRAKSIMLAPDAIAAATATVKAALPSNFAAGDGDGRPRMVTPRESADGRDPLAEIADEGLTPEEHTIELQEQADLDRHLQALRAAIPRLPPEVRLYLQHVMSKDPEPPPRDIARLMGRPSADVYRLKQQAERLLRQALGGGAAAENRGVSV